MRRRDWLRGSLAAAGLCLTPGAWALGDSARLDIAELDLGAGSIQRPDAWKQLLYEIAQTTSIETRNEVVTLKPEDPSLFEHPFAVLTGDGALSPLGGEALEQLRRYLRYGGFLFIDSVDPSRKAPFDSSVRRLCRQLFPTRPVATLPEDHSLYRAFFLLDKPVGRVGIWDHLEGVTMGHIAPIIYGRNDLSGALTRGQDGRPARPIGEGGSRGEAIKLGINLVMYALTSNYKKDQAHVRRLLEEGRIR